MARLPSSHAAVLMPTSAGVILHRALHLKDIMHMRVEIARETSDGVEPVHVNTASAGAIEIIADVKIDNLTEHQAMGTMAHRQNLHHPTLHANGRPSHTRRLDLHARNCRETCQRKLIDVWGIFA